MTARSKKSKSRATTGNNQLDDRIRSVIGTMPALPEAPPKNMPQPVVVRIGATPGFG